MSGKSPFRYHATQRCTEQWIGITRMAQSVAQLCCVERYKLFFTFCARETQLLITSAGSNRQCPDCSPGRIVTLLMLPSDDSLYTAGQLVPPGRYLRVDAYPAIEIILDQPDVLPASFDGHVAVYQRIEVSFDRALGNRLRSGARRRIAGTGCNCSGLA